MFRKLMLVAMIFAYALGHAQTTATSKLSDSYLSNLEVFDPRYPGDVEVTYLVEKAAFYDENLQLIPAQLVQDYRLNADYSIDKMYIDDQKFVKVVVYRKSTSSEKIAKQKTLNQLEAKDPNDFRGTYPKPFQITDMNGKVYTPESLRGKVVVINYWFIGCAPCEKEMPMLNQLVEKYEDKDVIFLALTPDKKEQVAKFLKKKDFDFNIIPDASQMITDYNVTGFPTHMLIDKKLVIQYLGLLPEKLVYDKLDEAIGMLLAN
ncbi:TlpA family protein disulfide reductase [Nonlabens ponticola]|uniref:TlpA family protein disulfide reductase n=1 Tax=Nonlabens ponticola TaxID=2496866 RepID=A0A3S9MVC5_9FLAO|nr:TlpA disulfide reductase family protein [Nonlabens ponticola]AZQ43100.1 TlpA family protein disulfide reductase [Nonlabens ponticola]